VKTLVKLDSGNTKTGHVAVTYRTQDTCPTSCPLMAAGCYARGRIFGIPARLGVVDEDGEYSAVRALAGPAGTKGALPQGGLMRANVSGDVLNETGELDTGYAAALSHIATERPDADVFTYTHAWRKLQPDLAPGVTVNASCESAADLEEAAAAGWPTVVTDPGDESTLIGQTVAGRKVVQCPAQTKGLTCDQCRLCARPQRRSTVAFVVHGSGKKLAANSVKEARA
jgi:hypothetical protein